MDAGVRIHQRPVGVDRVISMNLRTFTESELNANPSLVEGLVFLSRCSDANTRTYIVPEKPQEPKTVVTPAQPAPQNVKKTKKEK